MYITPTYCITLSDKLFVIPLTETKDSITMKGRKNCSKELYEFSDIVEDQNKTLMISSTQVFEIKRPN
jgi:uncharacterized phosphosugar-binding protein